MNAITNIKIRTLTSNTTVSSMAKMQHLVDQGVVDLISFDAFGENWCIFPGRAENGAHMFGYDDFYVSDIPKETTIVDFLFDWVQENLRSDDYLCGPRIETPICC